MHGEKSHVLRPRVFVYATLLLVLTGGLITSMVTRTPIILDVIRDRNQLYRELPDGMYENIYTLKIVNQQNDTREYTLTVDGTPGIELDGAPETIRVAGGGVESLPVRVRANREDTSGINDIFFTLIANDDPSDRAVEDSRLIGPMP